MDIRKLQRAIVDGLEDVKAQNIAVFNTEHLSPMFERVIIASGTSNRQTKALASSVITSVRGRGMQVLRTEGQDNGEWIIVDCGAAVVHVMQPNIRDYYHLEELWGGKNVSMKMAAPDKGLVKAAAAEAPGAKAAPRKAAAAPAPKRATTAPASKKAATAPAPKKTLARQPASKKPSAGQAAPRKPAAKKKPVSQAVGKRAAPQRRGTAGTAGKAGKAASRKPAKG